MTNRAKCQSIARASEWLRGAKGRSARIAAMYLVAGSVWIVLSDTFAWGSSSDPNSIMELSIVKGLLYVALSALLIFFLVFQTLREIMRSRETILRMNGELTESSRMYKGLSEAHANRQALLKGLIDAIPDLIFHKDLNRRYLGCNRAFQAFVGQDESGILGKTDAEFLPGSAEKMFLEGDEACLAEGATQRYEKVIEDGGEPRYFETIKTPYRDAGGSIIGLIGISRDVTKRRLEEERILYLSTHDAMTGLHNRAYLAEAAVRMDQPERLPLTVVMGDINGLKLINDSLGHARGDRVIAASADILGACLRPGDVVARTGGDEFTALLPNTDDAAAAAFVESIRAACRARAAEMDELRFAGLSLGWATKYRPEDSLDEVRKAAEDAMYRRKILEHRSLHSSILTSMKKAMLEKSDETEAHAERLAALSRMLGKALKLPDESLVALELLSTLHDIGKIAIDKNILTKVEPLTEAEWQEIKKHPEVGYRIAQSSPDLMHIAEYILSHHERWDGGGYPRGISGTAIPMLARVLSVVDSFDAMTQDRSYRKAMPLSRALDEIRKNAGTQFDPVIADAFLTMMGA